MAEFCVFPLVFGLAEQAYHLGPGSTFKSLAMHNIGDHSAAGIALGVGRLPTLGIEWLW
jgi:hypothetical protein